MTDFPLKFSVQRKSCPILFLRTFGGLGNQLFQLFYAFNKTQHVAGKMFHLHDSNYAHKFEFEAPFDTLPLNNSLVAAIVKMRMPRLLERSLGFAVPYLRFRNYYFLDSYFQSRSYFEEFSLDAISALKHEFISGLLQYCDPVELKNCRSTTSSTLVHIRLGDFFKSPLIALEYAQKCLRESPFGSTVVSNINLHSTSKEMIALLDDRKLVFQDTSTFSPLELLYYMSSFERIISNGSTLAFWASILSSNDLRLVDSPPHLIDMYEFLSIL